ncbi:MAG TPA: MFS transporter [Dermatophilaceae bacterium]|nr:MFS transporter [Dermatophilaceae bacterium]
MSGQPGWSPWRVVIMFGLVSLAADMVYEGARSLYGPLLAALGASSVVVGAVTGAGEAMALVLRLVFGPMADRTGRYWGLTIAGYALTIVCVPLLAVTPFVGGAGLALAAALILLERSGKAVRSPSKSALLAHVARSVGRGRGFGIHKAMDQTGAFAGPLLVAAIVSATGAMWTGLATLALPGVVALVLLLAIRARVPDPSVYDGSAAAPSTPPTTAPATTAPPAAAAPARGWLAGALGAGLPREFFLFACAASLTTGGLVTFGLIGYHLSVGGLAPVAQVPVIYSGAMLTEALAALGVGWLYDRVGPSVLYAVPVLVAAVPPLALSGGLATALVGIAVWGLAFGLQDSTIKAYVADIVEAPRRATAYGVFAGIQGVAAILGGVAAGWLYARSVPALTLGVGLVQAAALTLMVLAVRRARRSVP